MTAEEVSDLLLSEYQDLAPKQSWGETAYFVNPDQRLPSGVYFATLKLKDGENDKASKLDCDENFRLNFGPGKIMFQKQFGLPPKRPFAGGVIEGPWDFTQDDILTPHPVYGWMSWMAIKNPSQKSMVHIQPLLQSAYGRAWANAAKRLRLA